MILLQQIKHPFKRVFLRGRWIKVRRSDRNKRKYDMLYKYRGYKRL